MHAAWVIGASLSEPHKCGVRCLRTSTVSSENDREYIHGWPQPNMRTRKKGTAPEREQSGVQKTESGYGERAQRDKNGARAACSCTCYIYGKLTQIIRARLCL